MLLEKKWKILQRRSRLFRYIPFIDFVLVSGSMAMGDAKENSDFDVIIGARRGRIFTVRFLCWLVFSIFGWRAKHVLTNDQQLTNNNDSESLNADRGLNKAD